MVGGWKERRVQRGEEESRWPYWKGGGFVGQRSKGAGDLGRRGEERAVGELQGSLRMDDANDQEGNMGGGADLEGKVIWFWIYWACGFGGTSSRDS